jgi:seryl-tRNA synthetase
MLTLKFIRENKAEVLERLGKRHGNFTEKIDKAIEIDENRRKKQADLDLCLSESKNIAKEIGQLMKDGKKDAVKSAKAERAKAHAAQLREDSQKMNRELDEIEKQLFEVLSQIPNTPHTSVPVGKTAEDNVTVRQNGTMPQLEKTALPHWDLAKKYNIIDFELGNKLTGAGFPVYIGKGAKIQRALINFFLQEADKAGYTEIMPPIMVNEDSGFGTGQLPDKEGQMYFAAADNYYLIPTAEVPVTNIYRDVILEEEDFPIKMTAYTPCFRREAGSYGKDVRGLNRLHQFDKVEIVQIEHPDKSYETLDKMVAHVESLVQKLELPYRILRLCGGDMGFTSALTYDFEVYSAAQQKWLEVSSVSNFESFQANRLKLRYKEKVSKKTQLAHTLNGSALALPRILAALLENNQTEKGIKIPPALVSYTGFEWID